MFTFAHKNSIINLYKTCKIRTGASPGTFRTVSGTARMVPAEDLSILIGSQLECTSIVEIFKRKCSTILQPLLNNWNLEKSEARDFALKALWMRFAVKMCLII